MNADVEKALQRLTEPEPCDYATYRTIRQTLRDQGAEIARLRKIEEERWNVVATRNAAVERAKKADALLHAIKAWDVDSFPSRKTPFALPLYIRARITAHLGAEQ